MLHSLCSGKEEPGKVLIGQHKNAASLGNVTQEGICYSDAEEWEKGSGARRQGRAQGWAKGQEE